MRFLPILLFFLFAGNSLNAEAMYELLNDFSDANPLDSNSLRDTSTTFPNSPFMNHGVSPYYSIWKREIRSLSYRSINDLLALQNGVVEIQTSGLTSTSRKLHVRGGQEYQNAYYINGINVTDPITGLHTASFSTLALRNLDFYSGYMPASFGHATSSIINLQTIQGTDQFTSYAEALSDNVAGTEYDRNWYTASAGGPIPGIASGRFFGLLERQWFGDRNPSSITSQSLPNAPDRLPNNWLGNWAYHGRMDIAINDAMDLRAHIDGSESRWSEYQHGYLFNIEHMPYHDDDNLAIGGSFRHQLNSEGTSYELGVSYFKSERFRGDGLYREDLFAYGRPIIDPGTTPDLQFWSFDNPATAIVYDTILVDGQPRVFVVAGDESHVFNDYLKHKSVVLGIKGNLKHTFFDNYHSTIGFEFQRNTIRYYNHLFPTDVFAGVQGFGFVAVKRYGYDEFGNESDDEEWQNDTRNPLEISFFAKSQFDFKAFNIEGGIRVDVFDYDALALRNPSIPLDPDNKQDGLATTLDLEDLEKVKKIVRISPRLSAVWSLSNKLRTRFSFGIYYQRPPLQFIQNDFKFLEWRIQTGGFFTTFGNPDFDPLKSRLYEAGIEYEIGTDVRMSMTAYIKDMDGLVSNFVQSSFPTSFSVFSTAGDVENKGIELDLNAKAGDHVKLRLGYTLSDASTLSGFGLGNVAWVNAFPTTEKRPLEQDQRHKLVGIFEMDFRNKGRGSNQPIGILNGIHLSVITKLSSGLPYTPINIINESIEKTFSPIPTGAANSERTDWTFTLDFNLERTFNLGSLRLTPYLWVRNAFDKANVSDVWSSSGQPDKIGWLETTEGQNYAQIFSTPNANGFTGEQLVQIKEKLPINYWNPRQVFLGLKAWF